MGYENKKTLEETTKGQIMTKWEKTERIVFLVGIIIVMLDVLVWRP